MAFPTVTEANALRQSYINTLPARLEAAVRSAAASGASSVVFSYAPAADVDATNFRTNVLLPAGWANSVVNTTDKTITVAP
jgi:hypothetical protein